MSTYDDSLLAARFSALAVEPLPGDWADVVRRADARKVNRPLRQRRRLLVVLALVAFVAVVSASALAVRAFVIDKGFIGLPPVGATPSTPESGDLVVHYFGPNPGHLGKSRVWVYADGRVIWLWDADHSKGANHVSTGFLEQRLTREGVELLRSEVVSKAVFGDDQLPSGGEALPRSVIIDVRKGDRLVRVERTSNLQQLIGLLADPVSWLPARAWEDEEIRAYVPARYAISYGGRPQSMEASRILTLLPASVQEVLRDRDRTRTEGFFGTGGVMHVVYGYSSEVTTEEARTLAETLDDAGFKRSGTAYALAYTLDAPGTSGNVIDVTFEPMLPNGEATCSACG